MFEALDPKPIDAQNRLRSLDLQVDDLLLAVRAGALARRTATSNHPRSYGGWKEYGERVAALRDALAPQGWKATEPDGVCLTVHPGGAWAIMTAQGTAGTGTAEPVTTRRSKGERTTKFVRANAQLELELDFPGSTDVEDLPPAATWVLLVYTDGDIVRSELSRAVKISDEGYINDWAERIALPVIRLNDVLSLDGDDDDGGRNYDFEVTEK
ncbi:hypothetical protein [Quadrisphaera sp. KR29]|uniref:hypothetical protein n=1 Tax=Quadrisphaera sp. KR29 TaxID=3461391 RepID=UPI0040442227